MQAGGQPRNFAAHGIPMQRAAADSLVQNLGGLLERLARLGFVAARGDRFRRRLGQGAGTRPDDAVALGAFETLPMTLLGRWMNWNMRHNQPNITVHARRSNRAVTSGSFLISREAIFSLPDSAEVCLGQAAMLRKQRDQIFPLPIPSKPNPADADPDGDKHFNQPAECHAIPLKASAIFIDWLRLLPRSIVRRFRMASST